jgi:hypothetical protein
VRAALSYALRKKWQRRPSPSLRSSYCVWRKPRPIAVTIAVTWSRNAGSGIFLEPKHHHALPCGELRAGEQCTLLGRGRGLQHRNWLLDVLKQLGLASHVPIGQAAIRDVGIDHASVDWPTYPLRGGQCADPDRSKSPAIG